ncbi:uncharacterized protein LOC135144328 [Zophobas morio]|uniref:uncharacterized protein LOC135144328 n=1 Tax=Zophobas morio TaxID=2755281 RepID=UPI003082F1F5
MHRYSKEDLLRIGLQRYHEKKNKEFNPSYQKKCQRCLRTGHLIYECKNDPKYLVRPSRSKLLQMRDVKKLKMADEDQEAAGLTDSSRESTHSKTSSEDEKSSESSDGSTTSSSDDESDSSSSSSNSGEPNSATSSEESSNSDDSSSSGSESDSSSFSSSSIRKSVRLGKSKKKRNTS